jgi:ATP-dependent Lhr-like helicase
VERAVTKDLRERLRRSWYALFAHHPDLLPVQRAGIPPLLDGRECLLCAATAGGKTEALVAAAFEALAEGTGPLLRAIYVCPTRALVNDAHRRLEPPARRLGLRLARHTADHNASARDADLLLTTPEGLDSWLARRPAALKDVRWLLLDELHLLAGTPRGDQLAAVAWRLRKLVASAGGKLRAAAASATVAHPEAVAARYLEDPLVVTVPPPPRTLNVEARPARTTLEAVEALSGLSGKTLVFVNARNDAEKLAHGLRGRPPLGDAVYVHHGSLLREERERVEAAFLSRRHALCVATTTLELGIDIGDVDRVALFGPPPDVTSFLQRIGRAGRRSGNAGVLLLARKPSEALRFAFLVERAAAGDLCADLWPYHPGTVYQQAASLLFQNPNRTLTVEALLERLPPWQAAWWTPARLYAALGTRTGWLQVDARGVFRPADLLVEAFERGRMHSQLADENVLAVYDALTGQALGTVGTAEVGQRLTLAGRAGEVVGRSGRDLRVRVTGGSGPTRFHSRPGSVLARSDATAWLRFLGLPPGTAAWLPEWGYWFHGLGAAYARVLATALSLDGAAAEGLDGLYFTSPHPPPPHVHLDSIATALRRHEVRLARLTQQGPDFARLPPAERHNALELALPPTEIRDAWRSLRWITPPPDLAERLLAVVGADDDP